MTLETIIQHNRLTGAGLRLALKRIGSAIETAGRSPRLNSGVSAALVDVAAELHTRNREAGWWTDLHTGEPLQRNVGELLMLMVSELGEFPPFPHSETEKDDKLLHRLMAEVELADCAIRLFDTIGALAPRAHEAFIHMLTFPPLENTYNWRIADLPLMRIVRLLTHAMEGHRKNKSIVTSQGEIKAFDHYLGIALFGVFDLGWRLGLDVPAAIAEKAEYNQQREDHKIAHRRTSEGKKY